MTGLELVTAGFAHLVQPTNIFLVVIGTFVGITFGVIPGLTGTICLVMLLPLTYAMHSIEALVLMAAVYCGAVFGGAISAITLNIPGRLMGIPWPGKGWLEKLLEVLWKFPHSADS